MTKKYDFHKFVINLTAFMLVILCHAGQAQAAEGRVTFGSDGYEWEVGQECPIGVYVEGEIPFIGYDVYLQYDPTALQYVDGAMDEDSGMLYITGNGTQSEYKIMLHFIPLRTGNTSIRVVAANCAVNSESIDGMATEVLNMTQLSAVPITVTDVASSQLATLTTEATTETESIEAESTETESTEAESVEEESMKAESITEQMETEELLTLELSETETVQETVMAETISETEADSSQDETVSAESGLVQLDAWSAIILRIMAVMVSFLIIGYGIYSFFRYERGRNNSSSKVLVSDEASGVDSGQKVISVNNVTMKFRLASDEASSLKEYVIRSLKHQLKYRQLTALDNISFEVMQGEVIGIIGTNGSGKSTLLKIISGALNPTSGSVDVDRSKVQMLTLGTGFDMELTARENVYLNGAIIGYSKEYIDEKYDDIVKFAELEGFMEERMKNFSSGMISRLGFAIATMRDAPDILILDEVLSVGDMFFRKKSAERIKEMIHSGATVLIVSHGMDTIMKNCDRVVWIEKGKLMMVGEPKEVCEAYRKMNTES